MKILVHVPWNVEETSIGGTENFAISMCTQFRNKGHDAFIVCTSLTPHKKVQGIPVYGRIPKKYCEVAKKGINEFFYRDFVLEGDVTNFKNYCCFVEDQIKEFEYDFLILNSALCSLVDQQRFPPENTLVVNHENPDEFDNYWGSGSYLQFVKLINTPSNQKIFKRLQFVAESEYYANMYARAMHMTCAIIPAGVDYEHYSVLPDKQSMRNKYNIKNSEMVFLVPCRLEHKQKGQDIIVQAFGLIRNKLPSFRIVFSGNDPAYIENHKYLLQLAKKNQIEKNVQFEAFSDIREGYAMADAVLLAERFASYGYSFVQSISLGIPVIASNIPTFKEIASNVSCVKLIENTPDQFANEILNIAKKIPRRNLQEGKEFANRLSWSSTADRFIQLMKVRK